MRTCLQRTNNELVRSELVFSELFWENLFAANMFPPNKFSLNLATNEASMIIHILPAAPGFPAVSYNTNKIDRNKGELMKVSGFGALQGLQELKPEDYKIHLRMIAANNQRVKKPQFHAVLSTKGKEHNKLTLTEIAEKWLESMGYAKQPYLIIFHKDTNNNHVHMVSVRVDHEGKKISDKFEKIRAVQQLNLVLGIDEKQNAVTNITAALTYQFTIKAQFMMILEGQGYVLKEVDGEFKVIKFGRELGEIQVNLAEEKINNYRQNEKRTVQLKALFYKYAATYSTALTKSRNGFTSDFAVVLKEKFGIDLRFHSSGDKPAYGYSVIDHSGKQVLKGSEVIPLMELLAIQCNAVIDEGITAGDTSADMMGNPGEE